MDYELPGSLIYQDERSRRRCIEKVLRELTGVVATTLTQFEKAFGRRRRTARAISSDDVHWLEKEQAKVKRIVTIAYFSLVKT